MRQVRPHRRRVTRERPKPRWVKPAIVAGSLLLGCGTMVGMGWWLVAGGYVAQIGTEVTRSAAEITRGMGLEVKDVLAVGRGRTKSGDIRDKLENIYGQNILLVDIADLRTRLESLPWVRSVTVRRLLPDTLRLELVERRPFALWRDGGRQTQLIDEQGVPIEAGDLAPFLSLPVVSGDGARAKAADLFRRLREEPDLARHVTGAELVDERRWNIFLDGRIVVKLPAQELSEAWALLARTERQTALLQRAISAVDLRNPDWLIVRLMDEVTGSATGQAT